MYPGNRVTSARSAALAALMKESSLSGFNTGGGVGGFGGGTTAAPLRPGSPTRAAQNGIIRLSNAPPLTGNIKGAVGGGARAGFVPYETIHLSGCAATTGTSGNTTASEVGATGDVASNNGGGGPGVDAIVAGDGGGGGGNNNADGAMVAVSPSATAGGGTNNTTRQQELANICALRVNSLLAERILDVRQMADRMAARFEEPIVPSSSFSRSIKGLNVSLTPGGGAGRRPLCLTEGGEDSDAEEKKKKRKEWIAAAIREADSNDEVSDDDDGAEEEDGDGENQNGGGNQDADQDNRHPIRRINALPPRAPRVHWVRRTTTGNNDAPNNGNLDDPAEQPTHGDAIVNDDDGRNNGDDNDQNNDDEPVENGAPAAVVPVIGDNDGDVNNDDEVVNDEVVNDEVVNDEVVNDADDDEVVNDNDDDADDDEDGDVVVNNDEVVVNNNEVVVDDDNVVVVGQGHNENQNIILAAADDDVVNNVDDIIDVILGDDMNGIVVDDMTHLRRLLLFLQDRKVYVMIAGGILVIAFSSGMGDYYFVRMTYKNAPKTTTTTATTNKTSGDMLFDDDEEEDEDRDHVEDQIKMLLEQLKRKDEENNVLREQLLEEKKKNSDNAKSLLLLQDRHDRYEKEENDKEEQYLVAVAGSSGQWMPQPKVTTLLPHDEQVNAPPATISNKLDLEPLLSSRRHSQQLVGHAASTVDELNFMASIQPLPKVFVGLKSSPSDVDVEQKERIVVSTIDATVSKLNEERHQMTKKMSTKVTVACCDDHNNNQTLIVSNIDEHVMVPLLKNVMTYHCYHHDVIEEVYRTVPDAMVDASSLSSTSSSSHPTMIANTCSAPIVFKNNDEPDFMYAFNNYEDYMMSPALFDPTRSVFLSDIVTSAAAVHAVHNSASEIEDVSSSSSTIFLRNGDLTTFHANMDTNKIWQPPKTKMRYNVPRITDEAGRELLFNELWTPKLMSMMPSVRDSTTNSDITNGATVEGMRPIVRAPKTNFTTFESIVASMVTLHSLSRHAYNSSRWFVNKINTRIRDTEGDISMILVEQLLTEEMDYFWIMTLKHTSTWSNYASEFLDSTTCTEQGLAVTFVVAVFLAWLKITQQRALIKNLQDANGVLGGELVAKNQQVQGLNRQVDDLNQQVEDLNEQVEGLDGQVEELNGQLNERTIQLEDAEGQIEELNGQVEGLNGQVEGLNGQVEGLNGQVEGLNGQVEGLNGQVEGLNRRVNERTRQLQEAEDQVEEMEGELEEMDGQLEELDSELEENYRQLTEARGQIVELERQVEEANRRHERNTRRINRRDEKITSLKNDRRDFGVELDAKDRELEEQKDLNDKLQADCSDMIETILAASDLLDALQIDIDQKDEFIKTIKSTTGNICNTISQEVQSAALTFEADRREIVGENKKLNKTINKLKNQLQVGKQKEKLLIQQKEEEIARLIKNYESKGASSGNDTPLSMENGQFLFGSSTSEDEQEMQQQTQASDMESVPATTTFAVAAMGTGVNADDGDDVAPRMNEQVHEQSESFQRLEQEQAMSAIQIARQADKFRQMFENLYPLDVEPDHQYELQRQIDFPICQYNFVLEHITNCLSFIEHPHLAETLKTATEHEIEIVKEKHEWLYDIFHGLDKGIRELVLKEGVSITVRDVVAIIAKSFCTGGGQFQIASLVNPREVTLTKSEVDERQNILYNLGLNALLW